MDDGNDGLSFGQPNVVSASSIGTGPPWAMTYTNGTGLLTKTTNNVFVTVPLFTTNTVYEPNNPQQSNATILNWKVWAVMIANAGAQRSRYNISPNDVTNGFVNSTNVLVDVSTGTFTNTPNYLLTPGPGGWQETDTNVAATLIKKGNYYFFSGTVPAGENPSPDTVPSSYYLSGRPSWFGNMTWPPFDSSNPSPTLSSIPAGLRFFTGQDPLSATYTNSFANAVLKNFSGQ